MKTFTWLHRSASDGTPEQYSIEENSEYLALVIKEEGLYIPCIPRELNPEGLTSFSSLEVVKQFMEAYLNR